MHADDETWLGQLREVRLGKERATTDLEKRSQRQHFRRLEHGRDHRRWPRHPVHHGPSRRIQAGPRLDRREPRLRYREYLNLVSFIFAGKRSSTLELVCITERNVPRVNYKYIIVRI